MERRNTKVLSVCFSTFFVTNCVFSLCLAQITNNPAPKVLVIHSYHPEFGWTSGIHEGILSVFRNIDMPIELKVEYLDTKRNKSEEFIKAAATKAKSIIKSWKPDVVVVSDDNAAKYVIVPYFKDTDLPVVFCGVNWDASIYGFPCRNVTGMIEVGLINELLENMSEFARGPRIGYLAYDSISARKDATRYKRIFNIKLSEKYVDGLEGWKKAYANLQEEVDMLILSGDATGMADWATEEAKRFVEKTTRIPTGTIHPPILSCTLLGHTNVAQEQGEWAATTALRILNGEKPSDIPVARNRKAKVYLNMTLAKKLGVKFPIELIERSTFVEELKTGGQL